MKSLTPVRKNGYVTYVNSAWPSLRGRRNEYQPMDGDALRLGSKGKYGSCLVAGKTVQSLAKHVIVMSMRFTGVRLSDIQNYISTLYNNK